MPAPRSPTKRQEAKVDSRYGPWDFARDFSTQLFALLNTGRIFPAILVLLALLMLLAGVRMPTDEVAPFGNHLLDVINGWTGLFLFLLLATNAGWLVLYRERGKLHEREIKRLTEIRKQLMHGENLTLIKHHRSSDGEQQEGYLLPGKGRQQSGGKEA